MSTEPHIVVVGAGIIGASVALHLLRGGARVTVLEASEPGGVATRNSWAWINASWGNPHPYFRLRVHSMQLWRELERTVPGLRVAWVGGLNWELPADGLRRFAAEHARWGYDIRLVDRDAASALEPALANPPAIAVHAPGEGVVEPLDAALAMLAEVGRLGGRVRGNTPARALDLRGGLVCGIVTDAGPLAADEVVVAAGVGAAPLLATVGYALPLRESPARLIVSRPHAKLLNGLLITPTAEIRQIADGRMLVATSAHSAGDVAPPGAVAALRDEMQILFGTQNRLEWQGSVLAHRPMPRDGFSLVGRIAGIDGLYVAVTHSGITLAPAIGRFAAEEILAGRRDVLLAPFGLDRFDA